MRNTGSILCLALLAGGCASPHVELFSADGSTAFSYRDDCYYGDKLLTTTPRSAHLFRISMQGPNAREFRLFERTAEGAVVRDTSVPAYYVNPSSHCVALRPDGKVLAYLKTDGNLYAYDLDTRAESMLLAGVGYDAFLGGLAWADAVRLVLVLDRGRDLPDRILTIDTAGRRIVAERESEDPSDFALSPSGRRLAVKQMVRGSGVQIIDVPTLSVAAEIPGTHPRHWANLPAWNPSETRLAYLDGDNWLSVATLGGGPPVRVAQIPHEQVCYFLAFPSDELLVYHCGLPWPQRDSDELSFFDLRSARVVRTLAAEEISPCVVVADGALIACEVLGSIRSR